MKCPACSRTLSEMSVGGVQVDVCVGGCGGIWFDDRELRRFDDAQDLDAAALLRVERDESVKPDPGALRYCPRCTAEELCRRFYDVKRRVEVDQCLRCSGIWLDVGELELIRAQFRTDRERQDAGDHYLRGQLERTEDALEIDSAKRLVAWEDDVAFFGVLKSLFGFLLRSPN